MSINRSSFLCILYKKVTEYTSATITSIGNNEAYTYSAISEPLSPCPRPRDQAPSPADSLEAQSGLKTISTVLSDLLSRYSPDRGHRPFLLNQLNTAAKLEADIRAVLESSGHVQLNGIQPTSMLPANATFEDLARSMRRLQAGLPA